MKKLFVCVLIIFTCQNHGADSDYSFYGDSLKLGKRIKKKPENFTTIIYHISDEP